MKISVGMFGFGKTGCFVAEEIMKEPTFDLKWVVRKSRKSEGEFASSLLGLDGNNGKIYSIDSIDTDSFYKENYVDIIIDFSANSAVESYKKAAEYGTRIVSAVSKYEKNQMKLFRSLGNKVNHLP